MGSLSLGRPKWEEALGPKVAQEGRAPGGASRKLPPPPWRLPKEEETLGRRHRAAPSSKVAPLPLPL